MNYEDMSDWYLVSILVWKSVPDEWLKDNIKDRYGYTCFGHYWYFKKEEDAILFKLRWV